MKQMKVTAFCILTKHSSRNIVWSQFSTGVNCHSSFQVNELQQFTPAETCPSVIIRWRNTTNTRACVAFPPCTWRVLRWGAGRTARREAIARMEGSLQGYVGHNILFKEAERKNDRESPCLCSLHRKKHKNVVQWDSVIRICLGSPSFDHHLQSNDQYLQTHKTVIFPIRHGLRKQNLHFRIPKWVPLGIFMPTLCHLGWMSQGLRQW